MDPNSQHQTWSKWTVTVIPPSPLVHRTRADVEVNAARFFRKAFGTATQCRIRAVNGLWTFDVRTEGHPVHDPSYADYMAQAFARFFTAGFGPGTQVTTASKLEAGSRQDGAPADQLLILPTFVLDSKVFSEESDG
jgi:cobalamin biosynthesis Mg chelatase CobN